MGALSAAPGRYWQLLPFLCGILAGVGVTCAVASVCRRQPSLDECGLAEKDAVGERDAAGENVDTSEKDEAGSALAVFEVEAEADGDGTASDGAASDDAEAGVNAITAAAEGASTGVNASADVDTKAGMDAGASSDADAGADDADGVDDADDAEPMRFSALSLHELNDRLVGNADPIAELKLIEADISARERAWKGHGRWAEGRGETERQQLVAHALGRAGEKSAPGLDVAIAGNADGGASNTNGAGSLDAATDGTTPDPDPDETPIPSGIELYLAHRLRESGLFDEGLEMPRLHIVRPHASGMFYLRVEQAQTSYAAMLVVLRIEAALNAVRFASRYYDSPATITEREVMTLQRRIASSIVAQVPPIDEPLEDEPEGQPDGEWEVRHGISKAIESFQLPYRLEAAFRTNVADGNVAFEVKLTPSEVFPREVYQRPSVAGALAAHRPIPTTRQMRRQMASDYALRLALLLAASAFRQSKLIKHVWVAGTLDTATRHDCYFSMDFDRWRFAKIDLEDVDDLPRTLHPFCPTMRLEEGFLRPVTQSFSLNESRFCPPRRFESVSLSSRTLQGPLADALGTNHVSGLAIDEAEKREAVADDIVRHLVHPNSENATAHNVHAILQIAGDDPDPSVRSAAERTAGALVRGDVKEDPLSLVEEFVSGDDLTRAVKAAQAALGRKDGERARAILSAVLSPIDDAGLYQDSEHVIWRYFAAFVDRALFNRLDAAAGRTVMLVPASYFSAHLMLGMALMATNHPDEAERHARLLVRIAPLDTQAHLQLIRTLEMQGKDDEATDALRQLLRVAHDPQSVGTAYYRMAFFQWKAGNALAAQACYALAMRYLPGSAQMVMMEMATLAMQSGTLGQAMQRELSDQEVADTLEAHDIPQAPTDRVSEAFFECARASLDAEIFPVARNFLSTLAAFAPDDVIVGMMKSLEDAPGTL